MQIRIWAAIVVLVAFGVQSVGRGQGLNTGGGGMFGSRNIGGGVSGGTRTLGGSSIAGGMGGAGGIGQNMPANVGQVDASDRFVRGNRQAGEFVGAGTEDVQNFIGALQAGAAGRGAGPLAAITNRGGGANRGGRAAGRGQTDIRMSLRVAFEYPRPNSSQVSTALVQRLERLPQIETLPGLEVSIDRGTATLRGMVATQRARELAERLIRLEAGIWRVQNELMVAAAPAVPTPTIPPEPAAPKEGPAAADKPAADGPAKPLVLPEVPAEPAPKEPSPKD